MLEFRRTPGIENLRLYMRCVNRRPFQFLALIAFALGNLPPYALAQGQAPVLRTVAPATVTTTTTTTTTQSTTPTVIAPTASIVVEKVVSAKRVRSDRFTAERMAKYQWLDKAAAADPDLIPAITAHYFAALELAKHPRLGEIAEADHYLCRRLTKWKTVARRLAVNSEADKVIALDPEGMYRAIRRDKWTARKLVRNPMFDQMIYDNPDLGKLIAAYM